MKNIFYAFIFISLLFSCKSDIKQKAQDTIKTKSVNGQSETLIKKFKPILQGAWVNTEFIDAIEETKSPVLAYTKAANITTMLIDTKGIKGDTAIIDVGYGNHEVKD